jgi:hypothetical protein
VENVDIPDIGNLLGGLTLRYCRSRFDASGIRDGAILTRREVLESLQPAEVELRVNTMTQPDGIELPGRKPISHFCRHQDVVALPPIVPLLRGIVSLSEIRNSKLPHR